MRPTILTVLFLLSGSIELTLVLGQFGGGEPCTPGTAPPPVLRPLDSDTNYLPMCTPAEDRTQKPATNETTAEQLALCNSFCINRVFSGDFTLTDTVKQTLPGYPTWLLATQSYILSDQGTTTDCLVGGNSNGCQTDCNRFTPPFDFFNPSYGGYVMAQDCKDGCMMQFETPSQTVTACGGSCRLSCKSVACQCPFFGDGCFANTAPPCGRDCVASSCQLGCSDANSHLNNNLTYPTAANPNVPPVITQIGFGTRHLINITNSIPSELSGDVGYSTLIVRVLDLSSTTTDDYTYFVLENGFEFDVAPFTCRRVNISFAVATDQNGVSDYSPATTLEVPDGNALTPSQLTDFNITEEQDNRPGFVLHHMLHLSWELPQNVQFATNYTVALLPQNNPTRCKTASYTITNTSQTSYTIQSGNSADPPHTNCLYRIRIEVNPRTGDAAEKSTSSLNYVRPTEYNVYGSCSAVLDRNTISYDVTFYITFDKLFTPAVISAVNVLRVTRFEIDSIGNVIPGTVVRVNAPLDSSVEQGPVTVSIPYQDLPQLLDRHGYSLHVAVVWNVIGLLSVQIQCETFDVPPIPPDVVEDVSVTFGQAFPRGGQYFVTLQYTWTQPAFQGEGVTGYQVWLNEESPAPEIIQQRLEFSPNSSSGEIQASFTSATSNFILYFQIRAISANTQGPWSQVQLINVSTLVLPEPNRIEDDQFNITKFVYSVSDSVESSDNLTIAIEVDLQVLAPTVRNGTVEHFQVYVGSERADGLENNLIITRSQIVQFNGGTSYAGIYFTNRRIYGFGSTFYLQVRGRSTFEDVKSFGEWSIPEILTVKHVPPPEDVQIRSFDNVERALVNQQLKVSVSLSFEWMPPLNFAGSVYRYEVILSRQPVGRFSDGSVESVTRPVTTYSRCTSYTFVDRSDAAIIAYQSFNSMDMTFTDLVLETTTFDELTLYIQMRTISNDIILGGGEWSLPAVNFTLPAQPPTLDDNSFNATSFTYSIYSVTGKLHVDVSVAFSFNVSDEIQATFNKSSPNFTLNFQIHSISANTHGAWSETITFDVKVPSSPVNVVSYGDVIVWEEPLSPNGVINKYEIQFFVLGSELSLTRSRNRYGTFYIVKDEDQLGKSRNANTYFRIRAETGAGRGQWSQHLPLSNDSDVTTPPPMTCAPQCTCAPCPTTCTCGTDTTTVPITTSPQPLEGVYFVLKGEILPNNSVIALADVGELDNSLFCKTSLTSCCGTQPNRFGQFYYPNGVAVPIKRYQQGFYRNRGVQQINLHRRMGITSPTGKFRCEIPDSNKVTQKLFITLL